MKICRAILCTLLIASVNVGHAQIKPPSENTNSKEFIASCMYGVLAGTLVGAASLAFTDRPGDNLNRVARGASLGLYTGIALGLYVVYIVPGLNSESEEDPVAKVPFSIAPTAGLTSVPDGAVAQWTIRF